MSVLISVAGLAPSLDVTQQGSFKVVLQDI